jgi:adenylate cyclase
MSLYHELKRRNVFRVAIAYLALAWLLTEVSGTLFPAFGVPEWGVRFVVIVFALGFVPALIISWAYELTPEGLKREKDVVRDASITHVTAKRLDGITIGLIVVALALVLADRLWLSPRISGQSAAPAEVVTDTVQTSGPEPQYPANSIAVLPFVNMSDDASNEYFSDGISEELLNLLAKNPELRVIARTSSFSFKGKDVKVADVARELNVNHVLEGSVRKAGNQVRITAQLIEARTDTHLWSETYDRKLDDIFAIQENIARVIAKELLAHFSDFESRQVSTNNLEAYDIYLKGRALLANRHVQNIRKAREHFEHTLRLDPEFTPAMAALSLSWGIAFWYDLSVDLHKAFDLCIDWAEKALAIDPDNAEALTMLAYGITNRDLDFQKAIELLERAVEIRPGSAEIHNFFGDVYTRAGNVEAALYHESKALELDPLSHVQFSDLSGVYLIACNHDKALEYALMSIELDPNQYGPHYAVFQVNFERGDLDSLKRAYKKLESIPDLSEQHLLLPKAQMHIAEGEVERAEMVLEEVKLRYWNGELLSSIAASTALALGNYDFAGEVLLDALDRNDGTWLYPRYVRMPEQAPDSEIWQAFWAQPKARELAELRRSNGLSPHFLKFGEAAENTSRPPGTN